MEATREGKSRCWDIWIVHLRSFLASWEAFYERVGRYVSRNPGKVILLTILFVILCGIGFWRLETEHRTLKLFVPTRSTSEKALKKGKPYFQNMMNSREEEMLLIPKNGNNVLTTACINDAIYISDKLTKIAGFRDLCLPKPQFVRQSRQYSPKENCSFANPFEILKYQVTDMYDMSYRLYNSKSKTSTLMSNGRAPVFNFGYNFAGLNFNRSSKKIIATAKAVRLLYYLKESENEEITKANLKWEKEFISAMKESEKELNCSNLYFAAARSMDDAVFESSTRDIPLISATFGIMIAFTCMVMSKFTNPIRGHSWLAVAGIFSTSLGILAGFGLTIACGVPFISLVGVLPFLVFSIGIDDMFIIVDELDRQPTSYSSENRVAYSLSKIGATITMTTVTDVLAFGISFTSSFPGIRYFCIYASLVITIEFLIQITFFMAFVSIDAKRIKANRTDCCPAFTGPDKNLCKIPDGYSFSTTIMETYAKFILKRPMKVVIMCMALLLLGFGIYGCMHVNNEFNRTTLALKDTYYSKYVTAFEKNFPQTIPVSLQIVQPIDYSHPNVQEQLLKMPSLATQTGHYGSMNVSWFHYFKDFVTKYKIKTNGTNFKKAVNIFLRLPPFRQHNLDVIRDDRKNIIASRILVFTKSSSSATFQKESMVKLREELQLKTDLPLDAISDPFIFFEQYAAVTKEVIRNLIGVAVTIVFVITPFCVHPVIVLFILLGFISLIVELFGIMYIFNISLNAISMINLVMAIGFSVDYSAHIAHAFISSTKTIVHDRVIDALCTVGVSVLLGGISTFLGMLVTGFSDSEIFQIFFRMFLGIVVFGLFNGMVVLPVLLSLFGRFTIEEKSAPDLKYRYYFSLGWNGFKSFLRLLNLLPSRDGNESARQTISVVGISARVPTAKEKEQFWSMLESGKDTISDYPKDREARYKYFEHSYNPNRPISGRNYVTRGSYMEDIDLFDYKFFGISNSEARSMDPQQRMLLQGAFEAIEDAGMKLEDLQRRRTGVYVGIMNLDYSSVVLRDDMMLTIDQFASTGTAFSIAANRLSFALNLMGPSVAIDTACSSSLTALSVACDHLREGRCDVAIVSAANLILCSKKQMTICRANMLAPDGRCKVFDERADGYGRGEAALTVILKRNDVAIYSEDDIYADLVSWGCNNDGQTAAPMTAPSEIGQKTLLHDVLLRANVNPLDVQYVETHGTGTIIGDMVETKTVGEVYGKSRKPDEPLRIGSVKSNINHTESAAGLAGLIKVSLMMKHKKLVPTVNIENHSARLGISDKGMMVQEVTEDWPEHPKGLPRLAAVNSFGYGGSNAHVVVKQPEVQRNNYTNNSSATLEERMRVLVLSARSQSALTCIANKFGGWLKGFDDTTQNQVNICYSLSERRTEHSYRLAVGFTSLQVAAKVLEEIQDSQESAHKAVCFGQINTSVSKIGLLFGGQGSQWKGMAGNLIQDKFILHQLHKVEYLAKKCGHETSIVEYLTVPDSDNVNESEDLITVQLSIFALEYAVGEFLKQKAGLSPKAVGGHSLGDITAACVSGSITLKEAVKIILARAGLQNRCNEKGAMAAIGLSVEKTQELLEELNFEDKLCIAAVNDEKNATISGDRKAMEQMDDYMKNEKPKVFWRMLKVQKAFHSHHMEPIHDKFIKEINKANIRPKTGQIPFISSVDGEKLMGHDLDPDYWWRNLRNSVLFGPCVKKMLDHGCRVLLEVSPRPVLSHYIKNIVKQTGYDEAEEEVFIFQALPSIKEKDRQQHLYVQTVGKLYSLGYPITWNEFQEQKCGKFVRYPLYSWQETSLWSRDEFVTQKTTALLLGAPTCVTAEETEWETELDIYRFDWMDDHKMKAAGVILPGATYVEMAFEAILQGEEIEPVMVKDLNFYNILPLPKQVVRLVRSQMKEKENEDMKEFSIRHVTEQGEIQLAKAFVKIIKSAAKREGIPFNKAVEPMIERQRTESQPLSASTDTSETGSAQGDLSDSQSSANSGVTKHDCGSSANSATSMSDSGADSNELKSRSVKSGSTTASTSGQSDSGAESLYPKNEHTALKAGYTTEDDDTVINVQERETAITDDDSEVIEAEQLNRHTSSLNESVDTEYIKKLKESLEEELTGEEFKELADKAGFDFGESFRLISHAWRDEDRALVQLSITEPVRKSIKGYIVHPCIIDACLQACIAIKSLSKETRQVIPIGIETIRLNPIRNSIKALYGYTEVNHATPDTCDLKLFNQNGDVIMYMHGFKVKDIRQSVRYPTFEKSIYSMSWLESPIAPDSSMTSAPDRQWVVAGLSKSLHLKVFLNTLTELGVDLNRVTTIEVTGTNMIPDFTTALDDLSLDGKQLIVVNLLPTVTHSVNFDVDYAFSAQWLAFESSLELLKTMHNAKVENAKLLIMTSATLGQDLVRLGTNSSVPWASTVLGMSRVVNIEQTKIPVICADVSECPGAGEFKQSIFRMQDSYSEEGLIVRGGEVYSPRFKRVQLDTKKVLPEAVCKLTDNDSFYLSWDTSRNRFNAKKNLMPKQMNSDFVEIDVSYVSSAIGETNSVLRNCQTNLSKDAPQSLSGIVVRIGEDAKYQFSVGDKVVAFTSGRWLKSRVRLNSNQVILKSDGMTLQQAAVIPVSLAGAYRLLCTVKSLISSRNKIYINCNAETQGFCWALSITAKVLGMNVTLCSSMNNVKDLIDGIGWLEMQKIAEESLKGEFSSLAGTYDCVICPAECHPMDMVALTHILKSNSVVITVDSGEVKIANPLILSRGITAMNINPFDNDLFKEVEMLSFWEKCRSLFKESGVELLSVAPIVHEIDPLKDDASQMVLDMHTNVFNCFSLKRKSQSISIHGPGVDVQGLKEDRSYIIIGGTRGLGLDTLKWMASRGAGTVMAVGRSSPSQDSLDAFKMMQEKYGTRVRFVQADVGQPKGIQILEDVLDKSDPIAGIVNSAVVLDDRFFTDVDRDNYRKVMGPKVVGTLLLHQMLERRQEEVDFFILYSSITSVLGNVGQTTYAAANTFMNTFADYRRYIVGKPCLAVCWGGMGGAGILERDTKVAALLDSKGLHLLHISQGLEWMDKILTTMPHLSNVCITDIDWQKFLRSLPPKKASSPLFESIREEFPDTEEASEGRLLDMILKAKSRDRQREILREFISRWLAGWIGGSAEEIDMNVPLFTYGIDSVGASALKGEIEKQVDIDFEVFYFTQPETTGAQLANDLLKAILDKAHGKKDDENDETDEADNKEEENENEEENTFKLPKNYIQTIYNPPGASAKFFIIHPSHRYSGMLQPLGVGFKFQHIFSMYVMGSTDPAYLGEDYESVRRYSQALIKLIQETQPHGPYFIGGYSFGGLCALEIASQLSEVGEHVELVVMIDTVRWIPQGRNNSQMLLEKYKEDITVEEHIQEQLRNFFSKIATTQLGMTLDEYKEMYASHTFEKLVEWLVEKAAETSKTIPDLKGIYESTCEDQKIASRCHNAWEPSANLYKGHVLYLRAEDDRFCRRVQGVGSADECWQSVVEGNLEVIKCTGDHYSMMEPARAPEIGSKIVTAGLLRFRRLLPNAARLPTNNCQNFALKTFKEGIQVHLSIKRAGRRSTASGKLRITGRLRKLKFIPDGTINSGKITIPIKRVQNILKVSSFSGSTKKKGYQSLGCTEVYSGLNLRCDNGKSYNIMCLNRQNYVALVNLLQALFHLPLQF